MPSKLPLWRFCQKRNKQPKVTAAVLSALTHAVAQLVEPWATGPSPVGSCESLAQDSSASHAQDWGNPVALDLIGTRHTPHKGVTTTKNTERANPQGIRKAMIDTQFKKGKEKGPGRPKGLPNKTTTQLKEMILGALDKAGGVDYLTACANDPKTASAFLGLVGKVLPMTLAGDPNAPPVRLEFRWKQ